MSPFTIDHLSECRCRWCHHYTPDPVRGAPAPPPSPAVEQPRTTQATQPTRR